MNGCRKPLTVYVHPCNDSHMNTTTTTAKYQPNQLVEVSVVDFASAGMPRVWVSAVVEDVVLADTERGLFDVLVRKADGGVHVERVGKRGGNGRIRAAA